MAEDLNRPKFLQRRHTDGQKAHENMLNITNYWRNANQNYKEVSFHISPNGHYQSLQTINDGEGEEKRETFYTVGGNKNRYNNYGEQYEASFKTLK